MYLKDEGMTREPTAQVGPIDSPAPRRGARLETALLDAAARVLLEDGYTGFTFEAVADRAKTSRPVLYRRWPDRDALLHATVRHLWQSRPIAVPDTGSLRDDAIRILRDAAAGRVELTMILNAALTDFYVRTRSSPADMREQITGSGGTSGLSLIVARAVSRGEIDDRPRPDRVLSLPFDLLRHELLMTMRPVGEDVLEGIVDDVWIPLLRGTAASHPTGRMRDSGR
jgi:AcrR family transcriptional regulator